MIKTEINDADFRVSSLCATSRASCVSVAVGTEAVFLRDTKDNSKTTLSFTPQEWRDFVFAVKNNEFDL
jgi:Domain of unknown function (DUF397)